MSASNPDPGVFSGGGAGDGGRVEEKKRRSVDEFSHKEDVLAQSEGDQPAGDREGRDAKRARYGHRGDRGSDGPGSDSGGRQDQEQQDWEYAQSGLIILRRPKTPSGPQGSEVMPVLEDGLQWVVPVPLDPETAAIPVKTVKELADRIPHVVFPNGDGCIILLHQDPIESGVPLTPRMHDLVESLHRRYVPETEPYQSHRIFKEATLVYRSFMETVANGTGRGAVFGRYYSLDGTRIVAESRSSVIKSPSDADQVNAEGVIPAEPSGYRRQTDIRSILDVKERERIWKYFGLPNKLQPGCEAFELLLQGGYDWKAKLDVDDQQEIRLPADTPVSDEIAFFLLKDPERIRVTLALPVGSRSTGQATEKDETLLHKYWVFLRAWADTARLNGGLEEFRHIGRLPVANTERDATNALFQNLHVAQREHEQRQAEEKKRQEEQRLEEQRRLAEEHRLDLQRRQQELIASYRKQQQSNALSKARQGLHAAIAECNAKDKIAIAACIRSWLGEAKENKWLEDHKVVTMAASMAQFHDIDESF